MIGLTILDKAFLKINRSDFLPEYLREEASFDVPLPIGYGQTNSQPYTVRKMLSWLGVKSGNKVLDIGSGSGWTTALLAHIVGPKGKVFAVERIPELLTIGRDNCKRIGIKNAQFFQSGDIFGLPDFAPFDRILVSATAAQLPDELLSQLNIDGKLVIPVHNDILEITKISANNYDTVTHPGFLFVPLL